jgi:oxygen-independent coproporphyrinogen III oxidase
MPALTVNLDLVRKYAKPGPRYTSYPTAPQFTDTFDRARLAREIDAHNRSDRPLSLYLHIPFCESLCWFCGCTQITTHDHGQAAPYLDRLIREIELAAAPLNPARRVVQLHFGGGTPNFLSPDEIRRLGAVLHSRFTFAPDAEIGVEFDPRRLTRDHVAAFRELGANRASLGIQDFDPRVQEAVHRLQPEPVVRQAIAWLRETGFESLNLDLIYGLPYQTPASFANTLARALALQPDRFAIFNYAHVPWMRPGQKVIPESALPSPEHKLEILKATVETLTARDWTCIGMDHFARAGDELALAQASGTLQRNFQGYSTRGGTEILAFGMSAISQTETHYRQNEKILPHYYATLDRGEFPIAKAFFLSADDRIRREVIMRLMCDLKLKYAPLSARLGIDFPHYFADALASLAEAEADGLVQRLPDRLQVTDAGRLLIRNLAMPFDAYLAKKPARFSQTV